MKKMLKSKWIYLFIAAVAATAWFLAKPAKVAVVEVGKAPVEEAVYATGVVESTRMVKIAPKASGRIREYPAEAHDKVKKGQILLVLENEDSAAKVAELEARVEFAKRESERASTLFRQGAGTKQEVDRTAAELRAYEEALKSARKQNADMMLLSPDNCTVIQKDGEIGELISAGAEVMWLDCSGILRITADIDEDDIGKVKTGAGAKIGLTSGTGDTYDGAVESITPRGDSSSRSYRVRIKIPQDTGLFIGMTVEANILTGRKSEAMLVPVSALSGQNVQTLEDGRVKIVKVSVGTVTSSQAEIASGLSTGAKVLRVYDESLKDGARAVQADPGKGRR